MTAANRSHFGFLTFHHEDRRGFVGGYLVLNAAGRPVEFHCSAPVKPTRPQEILYGNSLESYLCGEQIATALVKCGQITPTLIFTDCDTALIMAETISIPVVFVQNRMKHTETTDIPPSPPSPVPDNVQDKEHWTEHCLGGQRLWLPVRFQDITAADILAIIRKNVRFGDFSEPFSRIHLAIHEAQRT